MFLKPFKIKTNSQLKGSDRKKFRSALERCFPPMVEASAFPLTSKEDQVSQAKVVCHNGEIVQVYSINGEPVAYESRMKWYLTIYGLWSAPDALPSVLTWGAVIRKLANGADLMAPGVVVREENEAAYLQLKVGDHVQIRVVGCAQAVGVGVMLMDGSDVVSKKSGKAVQVQQLYGDNLWEMGSKKEIEFRRTDENDENFDDDVEESTENLEEQEQTPLTEEDNAELEKAVKEMSVEDDDPRSPQEKMDDLLKECFLSAIKTSHKNIELPILSSTFYSKYVLACVPEGQVVEIKKSSFKKVSTFLAAMKTLGYIDIKEEKKGVEHITELKIDNLSSFRVRPEFHPTVKENAVETKDAVSYQMPEIRQVFLVTAEVLPLLKGYAELRTHCSTVINKCSSSTCRNGELCCLDPLLNPVCVPIRRKFRKCSHSIGTHSAVKCLTNVHGCWKFPCPEGHSCCVDECNEPQCREDPVHESSDEHAALQYYSPTKRPSHQRRTTTARTKTTTPEHPHDHVEEMSSSLEYNGDSVQVVTTLHRRKTTITPIAIPVIHRVPYPQMILPMRGLLTGLLGALPPLPRLHPQFVESSVPREPGAFSMPTGHRGGVPSIRDKLPPVIIEP